jgi:hypothetical protein
MPMGDDQKRVALPFGKTAAKIRVVRVSAWAPRSKRMTELGAQAGFAGQSRRYELTPPA